MNYRIETPGRRIILQFLRIPVLALLLTGYWLYLRELVSPAFWAGAFILGIITAFFVTNRFRFLPAAGIFVLELVIARAAFFTGFRLMGEEADLFFFFFDLNYTPLLLPLVTAWLFTYWSLRSRSFIRWEIVINGWLLFLLFFSQGGYELEILPHPVYLASGIAVFLLLEVLILVLAGPGGGSNRKVFPLFAAILILILSAGFIFFLGNYSRGAVSRGGGLVKPTLFRFDFSRYVKLESEITMSSDLVLLFREEEPSQQPLLRRYVLSGYKPESGFFMSEAPGEEPQVRTIPEEKTTLPDPGWLGREDSIQEYFFVNFDPSSLVAMNYPVEITPLKNWDTSSFLRNYRVTSRVSGFLTWELIDSDIPGGPGGLPGDVLEFYTGYGEDENILELTEGITSGLENRYDRIMAIQNHLKENYYYSLKPGVADDGDQLHHFLFESKKGYCSYFAFSMALMCRSIGIPARVAVGFFIDPELGVMNIYPVRADMAHAWVEVFFPGYGWISFDPTSQVLAPGEDFQFGSLEVDRFLSLVEEILSHREDLPEEEPEKDSETVTSDWTGRIKNTLKKVASFWFLILPGIWLIVIGSGELRFRLKKLFCRNPVCMTNCEYRILVRRLGIEGMIKEENQSLSEWACSLEPGVPGIGEFFTLVLKSRYGESFTMDEYERTCNFRRGICRDLNRRISWKTVLRYLVYDFRRRK